MYGTIVAASILIATWFAEKEATEKNIDRDILWNLIFWSLIFGIAGARLLHVLDYWSTYYVFNPIEVFVLWHGGLAIFGGVAGGAIGVVLAARSLKLRRETMVKILDIAGLSLPLGQAFARWANYFNHELYGLPTNLPWAIYVPPQYRLPGFERFTTFHPLFLYESLLSLVSFSILFLLTHNLKEKFKIVDGDIFLLYFVFYGAIRLFLETLRIRHWIFEGVDVNIVLSLFSIIFPALLFFRRRINERKLKSQTK